MSVKDISLPQPHYIPGYTGHVPGIEGRIGDTYGSVTHKILLDPTTNHSEILVLSERTITDYELSRPLQKDIQVLEDRKKNVDVRFNHPITPGYKGFTPRERKAVGQRFTVQAEEGLAEFERMQMKNRIAEDNLKQEIAVQSKEYEPDINEKQLVKSEFKLPLLEVRPETCGTIRSIAVPEPQDNPHKGWSQASPLFMDNEDSRKFLIPGYSGHVPFGHSKYGQGYAPYTNSALSDFTTNFRRRQSTEWAPVTVVRPDPPLLIQAAEIYPKHMGMLPNYGGHIPGSVFRAGKTFGNDSTDAKKWLRGDFS